MSLSSIYSLSFKVWQHARVSSSEHDTQTVCASSRARHLHGRQHTPNFRSVTSSHSLCDSPRPFIPDGEVPRTEILIPSNLLPLFTSRPGLLSSLFPHLPPELLPSGDEPLTPQQTAQLTETLQRTINSPPFRATVAQLDRALRTGALGGFIRSLGLTESAGNGVGAFLRTIAEQAREGRGGSGQEDGRGLDACCGLWHCCAYMRLMESSVALGKDINC